ncbi:VOC family protein [Rhizohabitans arisaemae]|uniref:VOC family protein n=1 Tax=Rhizohabitans arisaemae TaxID=2720610 RepID=UPI0024B1B979|nr:VOC family protein [Rhizohabitans arisaemae]
MNVIAAAVSLHIDDVAASSNFFISHLGFREVLAAEGLVCLSRDDAAPDIVLQQRDAVRPAPPAGRRSVSAAVCFTVTGIADEHERLRREGAPITAPLRLEPWGEWVLQLTDPNGVVVQLIEWTPPAGA